MVLNSLQIADVRKLFSDYYVCLMISVHISKGDDKCSKDLLVT